jgi:hypothetical protein
LPESADSASDRVLYSLFGCGGTQLVAMPSFPRVGILLDVVGLRLTPGAPPTFVGLVGSLHGTAPQLVPVEHLTFLRGPLPDMLAPLIGAARALDVVGPRSVEVREAVGEAPGSACCAPVVAAVPTASHSTVCLHGGRGKFRSPAVFAVVQDVHRSVSSSFLAGVCASHLFLRLFLSSGLVASHPDLVAVVGQRLHNVFQSGAHFFCAGARTAHHVNLFDEWPLLRDLWRCALHRVARTWASAVHPAPEGPGDARVLTAAVDDFFHTTLRNQCGAGLEKAVRLLLTQAGAVPTSGLAGVLQGPWSRVPKGHRDKLLEYDAALGLPEGAQAGFETATVRGLVPSLTLFYGVREGSKLPWPALDQLVQHMGVGHLEVRDPVAESEGGAGSGSGPDVAVPQPVSPQAQGAESEVSDEQRLGTRILGALALRWAALGVCARLGAESEARARAVQLLDVEGEEEWGEGDGTARLPPVSVPPPKTKGKGPRLPSLVPLPGVQGRAVRLESCVAGTLLRRAGVDPLPPGPVMVYHLLNPEHPAIKAHVARYGPPAHSLTFTGGGLRLPVTKVSVTDVVADQRDAVAWSGVCRPLDPVPVFSRPLYGRQEPEARPFEEIWAKRAAFVCNVNGAYLLDHLTPELVRAHLKRTGARCTVCDPGVSCPLAASTGSFLSLKAMYAFMACRHSRARPPDGVVGAQAALSATTPRSYGVVGLMEYLATLGEVSAPQ